jgi:hypothetical protein
MEAAEESFINMHAHQLEYLCAGARSLEDAVTVCTSIIKSRKELVIRLERIKENLKWEVGGNSMKANLQQVWGKKGELGMLSLWGITDLSTCRKPTWIHCTL